MIRPLRRLHRGVMVVLAVGLPVLFAGALLARRSMPTEVRLPAAITGDPAPGSAVWHGELALPSGPVAIRVMEGVAGPVVELEPSSSPRGGGVLVFWSSIEGSDGARFLGTLGGAWAQRYALPPGRAEAGRLRLLSAHDGELLAEVSLGETP